MCVQFTKRLRSLKHLSYSDRLIKLGLPILKPRRLHPDLVYCYKMVFVLVKLNFADFFEFSVSSTIEGMRTNCISIDVRVPELTFSLAEW